MKMRIKALLAAAMMAAGCIFCTGCAPQLIALFIGSAITVPTTMGYVSDSRITSADQTAAQIRNCTTMFLTKLDSQAIPLTNSGDFTLCIEVRNGAWTVYGGASSDWKDSVNHWGEYADANNYNKESQYVAYMKDMLCDLETAYAEVHFSGGKCIGAAVIPDTSSKGSVTLPSLNDFRNGSTSVFSEKDGMSGDTVVGTAPKLAAGYYY